MPAPESGNAKTAAILLWILSAVQGMIFGCCSLIMAAFAMVPMKQWLGQPGMEQMDQETMKLFHGMAGAVAVGVFVVGCVPAVAYLVLGFFVKQRSRPAVYTCLIMLLLQTLMIGFLFASGLSQSVMDGNVMALTMSLLLFGVPIGLQLATMYHLKKVLSQPDAPQGNDWDKPESWE